MSKGKIEWVCIMSLKMYYFKAGNSCLRFCLICLFSSSETMAAETAVDTAIGAQTS